MLYRPHHHAIISMLPDAYCMHAMINLLPDAYCHACYHFHAIPDAYCHACYHFHATRRILSCMLSFPCYRTHTVMHAIISMLPDAYCHACYHSYATRRILSCMLSFPCYQTHIVMHECSIAGTFRMSVTPSLFAPVPHYTANLFSFMRKGFRCLFTLIGSWAL